MESGGEVYRPAPPPQRRLAAPAPGQQDGTGWLNRGERRKRMKLGTWIAALGLAWLACLGSADSALADPGKLARAECWFKAPDKISTRCYRLSVPESRAGRSDKTLELPVVVISVPATRKREDPVVYLAGGPGDGAWLDADRIAFWRQSVADHARPNDRDA